MPRFQVTLTKSENTETSVGLYKVWSIFCAAWNYYYFFLSSSSCILLFCHCFLIYLFFISSLPLLPQKSTPLFSSLFTRSPLRQWRRWTSSTMYFWRLSRSGTTRWENLSVCPSKALKQGCQTYGSQAKTAPLDEFWNVEKNAETFHVDVFLIK